MQVYYVPDSNPANSAVSSLRPVHAVYVESGWFITSTEKPEIPGAQDLSLKFLCDDQSFLNAAAAAQGVSPRAESAYWKIINNRGMNERFESICESRDVVIIEYLERVEKEWMGFAEQLDRVRQSKEGWSCLIDSIYGLQDRLDADILQHPTHWRPLLNMPVSAIATCIGLIKLLKRQDGCDLNDCAICGFSAIPLTSVKECCQQELTQLRGHITRLKAQISPNNLAERPSIYQLLLHLCLILLSYDDPAIRNLRGKEMNIASWSQDDWEKRCYQSDRLSDDSYEALVDALGEFIPFAGMKLSHEELRNQKLALMAGLWAIAGEITSETGAVPRKSDRYSHCPPRGLCYNAKFRRQNLPRNIFRKSRRCTQAVASLRWEDGYHRECHKRLGSVVSLSRANVNQTRLGFFL
ncbi:hypothetical protein I7I53_03954 [Histoplasma capsulatum var. duboisii H88]|uniref:Uncharacterized protein n=1 Tax=Ajellomyces capsulatus (strain H88) TaxID=544711 RepID=A0A8A1LRF8_AJEC8|nr:hypothetical protein I7I53_03954 [Histoplasma capsulatum var. duboisii H88]